MWCQEEKKKSAPSSAISQFSRNLTGHVIAVEFASNTLHTPRGSLALSLVQLGTLLLNGQSFLVRYRFASPDWLSMGNPKTSASGWSLIAMVHAV